MQCWSSLKVFLLVSILLNGEHRIDSFGFRVYSETLWFLMKLNPQFVV